MKNKGFGSSNLRAIQRNSLKINYAATNQIMRVRPINFPSNRFYFQQFTLVSDIPSVSQRCINSDFALWISLKPGHKP